MNCYTPKTLDTFGVDTKYSSITNGFVVTCWLMLCECVIHHKQDVHEE